MLNFRDLGRASVLLHYYVPASQWVPVKRGTHLLCRVYTNTAKIPVGIKIYALSLVER